jgi:hypothetical protein
MSEYTEQAEAFLKAHGIKFKAVYLEYGKHFPDDKEERDIYRLSLRRGTRGFSVRFGQSIAHSDYGNTPPTAYDLLACLTKYAPGTFENFCADYGYSDDSRKAEKVYKACRREWAKVSRFFTAAELEELQDIN